MRLRGPALRRVGGAAALIAAAALAWAAGLTLRHRVLADAALRGGGPARYAPQARLASGEEVVLVFITGSFCGASNAPELPGVVERAKLLAQARAGGERRTVRTVAVALDWDPERGARFLRRFGRFDQVSAGANWMNEGAVKYVWREVPGRPVLPQMVLLRRSVVADSAGIRIGPETLVRRMVGAREIEAWVDAGGPLPFATVAAADSAR